MAYVGRRPLIGDFFTLDAISPSATTTFNLLKSGSAYAPQTAANCIVSVNGVTQAPNTSYTISGTTIVFSTALATTDTIDYILVLGDVLNVGTPSAGTVNAASFASGFNGVVTWQNVQTTNFTAVAGRGYPVNTTSAGITVTLPSSAVAGNTIQIVDYAGTAATNPIVINPNGLKINSATTNKALNTAREAVTITYIDSTQGWLLTSDSQITLPNQPYTVSYLIVAGGGGGGGGGFYAGGGGAGGYLTSTTTLTQGTVYTITVGGGGTAGASGPSAGQAGNQGTNSSITGLTTAIGGGAGASWIPGSGNNTGGSGGSGGGGSGSGSPVGGPGGVGGSGTAGQGNAGGVGYTISNNGAGGGGGGAGATGGNSSNNTGGNGGTGTASSITGSSVTYAGGGGGGGGSGTGTGGSSGSGGGATGAGSSNAGSATVNTGGGGGGGSGSSQTGSNGGSGIVILSVPTTNYSGTVTGTYSTSTSGINTIISFTGSGTYTG
jgi:hypothetical protein